MSMTTQDYLSLLSETMEEVAGVPAADVQPDKAFIDDLGLDSLSLVEVAFSMYESTGVDIPDEELANLRTIQDFIGFLEQTAAKD